MTNNPKIDGVSLDAFKWAIQQLEEDGHRGCGYFDRLSSLLDAKKVNNREMGLVQFVEAHPIAPAVERQPIKNASEVAYNLQAENAALQSAIAQLQARIAELESDEPEWSTMQQRLGDENAQLRNRIAELESGRGEVIYQVSDGVSGWRDVDRIKFTACQLDPEEYECRALYTAPPAPVTMVHPFAEKVIRKLQRVQECAEDGQDTDIGRHWLDLLTQLGLLNRLQRSPARWEITQQGEDCLDATAALNGERK